MLNYLRNSFKRKKARRVTREYPYSISRFDLEDDGVIEFANWENPLVSPVAITQEQVNFFRRYIRKGDMTIDIGTNIGDTTVPMAIAAGKEGITLGFDPNPYVFRILQVNAGLNKDKTNIVPVMNAISVREEEFYFVSSEASFANGGLSKTKDSRHGKYVYPDKIRGINLTDFLEKHYQERLDRLSFIKIDAEGYDVEILKSISELISEPKPVIVAESFVKNSDEEKIELFDILKGHGYSVYFIGYSIDFFEDLKENAAAREITTSSDMTLWKDTINVVAVPENDAVKSQ